MSKLIIIRGAPGSAKSTTAQSFNIPYYEADMFFTDENGNYNFNQSKIQEAHSWCFQQVKNKIDSQEDVCVSNTFTKFWEVENYISYAEQHNYEIIIYHMLLSFKNIHGCPQEIVDRMLKFYEAYENERIIKEIENDQEYLEYSDIYKSTDDIMYKNLIKKLLKNYEG